MPDPSPRTWASALLRELGIHQTPGAIQALAGWARAEGGHWNNRARYNPLNTTQGMPGAGNTGSQGNIKVYRNWNQGLDATVKTLRNGRYGGILHALSSGDPGAVASAIGNSPWGTSGGLARSTIMSTPRVAGVHPFDGSGGQAPSGGTSSGGATPVTISAQVPTAENTFDPGQGSGVSALGGLLQQPAPPPPVQVPQAPNSAQRYLASAGAPPVVASSAPQQDNLPALLSAIQSPGGGLPEASRGSETVMASAAKNDVPSGPGAQAAETAGSAAASFAGQRIGRYKETTGPNRGPDLDILENRFGMRGQPWCAIFATTAAAHGGASRAVRTASVAQINQWASEGSHGYQRGLLPTSRARPGDLLTFGNDHVGVVERRLSDGRIVTVEGNTSSGAVQRRIRRPGEGRIARPSYR